MNIKIYPKKLHGSIHCIKSKSMLHRLIIASALSGNINLYTPSNPSIDIKATLQGVKELENERPVINCYNSGTTFRFLLPIVMALRCKAEFILGSQLSKRTSEPLMEAMENKGCIFSKNGKTLVVEGQMRGGEFVLPGNISSQFISGLLYALPLTSEGGVIKLSSDIESSSYLDMTFKCLSDFGVKAKKINNENSLSSIHVEGLQKYNFNIDALKNIDGDWSNGSFWITANQLGSHINLIGLNPRSVQGDKVIVDILKMMLEPNTLTINAKDIPDIVPILCVAASFRKHQLTKITNIQRLRFKESNRIHTSIEMIKNLGGHVLLEEDALIIYGKGTLRGGTIDSYKDHRIAMAAAIAATNTLNPVIIKNAESVKKSYPNFFQDYVKLGGHIDKL